MLKKFVLAVALCLLWGSQALAQEPIVEFEGRYWMTTLSAVTKWRGTDIDLKSDLGVNEKNIPYGRFDINIFSSNRLTLTYTPISYSVNTNIRRTIEFGGQTYSADSRVTGDFNAHYLRLGWANQFVNLARGRFKFGSLVEVKGVWGEFSLAAPEQNPPIKEARKFAAVSPAIGFAMDFAPLLFLSFYAEASGFPAFMYGYMWEAEAGVKYIPFPNFTISGGYRIFDLEARDDPDYAKVKMSGPFVGLSLRF